MASRRCFTAADHRFAPLKLFFGGFLTHGMLAHVFHSLMLAMAGKTDQAMTRLNEVRQQQKLDPLSLIVLPQTYSVMGEKTEAFEFLEAAYQERDFMLIFLDVIPAFDNIRSDPFYADLLRRMGLPQASVPTSS